MMQTRRFSMSEIYCHIQQYRTNLTTETQFSAALQCCVRKREQSFSAILKLFAIYFMYSFSTYMLVGHCLYRVA